MPAKDTIILTRKRRAQSERQNDVTILLLCFIAALVVMTLLFASGEFAEAMALMGSY